MRYLWYFLEGLGQVLAMLGGLYLVYRAVQFMEGNNVAQRTSRDLLTNPSLPHGGDNQAGSRTRDLRAGSDRIANGNRGDGPPGAGAGGSSAHQRGVK